MADGRRAENPASRIRTSCLISAFLFSSMAASGVAAAAGSVARFKEAKVVAIIEGKQVYINKKLANVNAVAAKGGTIGTGGQSRARILFDPKIAKDNIGLLKPNTNITIGSRCFRLEDGEIWIDGPQNGCIGSSTISVRSTTYVLARVEPDLNRVSVMHGQALIGRTTEDDPDTDIEPDDSSTPFSTQVSGDVPPRSSQSRYPTFSPIFGIGASAYTSNSGGVSFGEASSLVLGDLNLYVPIWQHQISQVLYSYTSASSNFDGFWGASSEVGYRWFSPVSRASQGVFVGYNGIKNPDCFHSQITLGAEYSPRRWFFGINGAIRADSCDASLSYAMAQVGIPVAQIGDNIARITLAPYLVTGLGNDYLGGRVGLSVPVSDHLSLSVYGQNDRLFDTVVGGRITYRFGAGRHFVNDPNRAPNPIPGASIASGVISPVADPLSPLSIPTSSPSRAAESRLMTALAGVSSTTGGAGKKQVEGGRGEIIDAGYEVDFNDRGEILARRKMSKNRFRELVESNLIGQALLPESLAVYATYKQLYGEPSLRVMEVTGARWASAAGDPYPHLRGADALVVPRNKLPQKPLMRDSGETRPSDGDAPREEEPLIDEEALIDFFP